MALLGAKAVARFNMPRLQVELAVPSSALLGVHTSAGISCL